MTLRILVPAALLFATGILTGLGVGRITQGLPSISSHNAKLPPVKATEHAIRNSRTNGVRLPGIRPPGAGKLEQFKRALGELDLTPTQRENIEAHCRETQEHLRALLKPVQPEATRELRALRQKIVSELSEEQRPQFERLNTPADRKEVRQRKQD